MKAMYANRRPVLGGFVGAVLGGALCGAIVGGVLLAASLTLIALNPYGLSSAHGMSFGEMGIIGLLGLFILTPLSTLGGAVGGGVAGAVNRTPLVRVALATVTGGIVTGLVVMLWVLSTAANWERDVLTFSLVSALILGSILGAVTGALGGLVGNKVQKM